VLPVGEVTTAIFRFVLGSFRTTRRHVLDMVTAAHLGCVRVQLDMVAPIVVLPIVSDIYQTTQVLYVVDVDPAFHPIHAKTVLLGILDINVINLFVLEF
jgi:hypothetical protein